MDVRVFDKELNALGTIDEIASLIWTIRYFSVGEIKILAPMTDNNRALLSVGNIVVKHDEYLDYVDSSENVWRRGAEITYVRYANNEKGQEQIEARGSVISSWLNQRVINPQIVLEDVTCQQVVNALISRNVGTNASTARKFPQFTVLTQEDLGGNTFKYSNESLKALGDEVRDVCQSGKIGYDILICERLKEFGFYLYKGRNLTNGNEDGNPPCIFSRDFENVNSQEFEDDTSNEKNHAFVRGAVDSQNVQEVVEVDRGSATGYDLQEVLVDASDIQRTAENSSGEVVDIPAAKYRQMLANRGETELDGMIENYTFNSSINTMSNLHYKEDFELGDRVTCVERQWGVTINSRITAITQTYESGKVLIEAIFGESAPTLLDKIKKVR